MPLSKAEQYYLHREKQENDVSISNLERAIQNLRTRNEKIEELLHAATAHPDPEQVAQPGVPVHQVLPPEDR